MESKLLVLFDSIILKHAKLTLFLLVTLVGFLSLSLPNLKLDASGDALLLEGDSALEVFRETNERYSSEEMLVIAYAPKTDLFGDKAITDIASLRDKLAVLPGVSSVVTLLDVPLLYSPIVSISNLVNDIRYLREPSTDRSLARKELLTSPIYNNMVVSSDASTTGIQVNLYRDPKYTELLDRRDALRLKRSSGTLTLQEAQLLPVAERQFRDFTTKTSERQRKLVQQVRETIAPYRADADIFLGGVPMIAADMIQFIQSDLVVFGSGIVLFVIVMLVVFFRSLRWVVLPLACCILSVTAMLGYFTWIDWRMTVISSNFVALLLIITLSVAIHLVVRYRELHSSNPTASQHQLVLDTVKLMAKPCLYTAMTTIVAFASLVVSGIRPVIDFGWMMTIGVAAALLMTFMVLPAGIMLLQKPAQFKLSKNDSQMTLIFARFTEHHGNLILVVSGISLLISIYGITQLEVENRFIDYFDPSTEIYQGMETIDRELGGTIQLDVLIRAQAEPLFTDDDYAEDDFADEEDDFADEGEADGQDQDNGFQQSYWFSRAGLDDVKKIHQFLDEIDVTGKVLSLATIYQVIQDIAGHDIDDIQLAIIKRNLSGDIKKAIIDPYLSADGSEARISLRVMETSHALRRAEFIALVDRFLANEMGLKRENYDLTGMLVLYNNMLQSLFQSQIATLGTVFCAIILMFSVLFRSIFLALLAIAPTMLAAALVLGGMGIYGIPLDMMTITIAAITVGIGVDHSIHYIHRYKQEFAKDRNYLQTMYRCHASIGRAMYYTSVTIIAGFSILALSNFTPSLYFGALTSFAMFCALLGGLILLPLLLIILKPLGPEQD